MDPITDLIRSWKIPVGKWGKALIDFLDKAQVAPDRIVIEITAKEMIENYAMFRLDRLLKPAGLCVMKQGWFDRIAQDHLARGIRDSQFKPLVLVDSVERPDMLESTVEPELEKQRA